ncbi:MAG: hypothetical protein ACE148_10580 [Vicinamibacterales bacterium]
MTKRSIAVTAMTAAALLLAARPASADITAFVGLATAPAGNRPARGVGVGFGFLVVGFEAEYLTAAEDVEDASPSFRVGSFNGMLQTPVEMARTQFYVTAGGGLYRERLGAFQETHVAVNTGGGAKIRLAGPLRLRVDYRLFRLSGEPLVQRAHRLYVGLNLAF